MLVRNVEFRKIIDEDDTAQKYFYSNGKLNNDFNSNIKNLKDLQFLENYSVKLGSKGGYDFQAFELSDIGKAIYHKLFNELPVESSIAEILRNHKTLEHGYLIKEVAIELGEMGEEVYEDRERCTYQVEGGKRKVFDLISIGSDGKKKFIEVERGTHNEEDFLNMMDKIYAVTDEIYFVSPNEKLLYKETKSKVFKWITIRLGGFSNAHNKIKFHFTTFEKIKKHSKKIWEDFAP